MRRNVRLQSSGIRRSIGVRVELETPGVRVIHQDEGGTVVGVEINPDALPLLRSSAQPAALSSSTQRNRGGSPPCCAQPFSLCYESKHESAFQPIVSTLHLCSRVECCADN